MLPENAEFLLHRANDPLGGRDVKAVGFDWANSISIF